MNDKKYKNYIHSAETPIKEVIRSIDYWGLRTAYIVDNQNKLIGVVSDSEIRKSILKGLDIQKAVKHIVNPHPIVLSEEKLSDTPVVRKTVQELLLRMPDSVYILVVDKNNCPKGMELCSRLMGHARITKRRYQHNSKSVLVVGGAGYLGSVLVRKLLREGFRVKVLDILMFGIGPIEELLEHDQFEFVKGDMRNISTLVQILDGVDAVINLAAIVGDPACKNTPEAAIETNYLANKALAEACKYHQINRFIYASTCSVYGAMNGKSELDEHAPLNPVSLYARSKIHSEEGILSLEDENFSPTILRMGTLYGYSPRMRFDLVVNTMTKTAIMDKKISVHNGGQQWRPLLHVEDAAEAYIKCLKAPLKKVKGAIFNVGSRNQNYQVIQIAEKIKQYISDASLIIEKKHADPRDYSVSFASIEKALRYKVQHNLDESILRIKKAIDENEIPDTAHARYYNVEV